MSFPQSPPSSQAQRHPQFYDARRLVNEVFQAAFMPPSPVDVAQWAVRNRWLSNEGGGYVGHWRHDLAPYLREPMEVLNDQQFQTVVIVGPGQVGKTEIVLNWLGASIDQDPANMLWYLQTEQSMQAFVKTRVGAMMNDHDLLKRRLGLRAIDDSLGFKRFRGMTVEFLAANRGNMISKSAGRIVADEWDAYDVTLGDPKALLDTRRQTFGRGSKMVIISHPDRAKGLAERKWTAGVMAAYAESDRRIGWWCCPQCGAWSSPNPTASRVMVLDYPEDAPLDEVMDAARLLCPVNGCVLDEAQRTQLRQTLRWIGTGQTISEDGTVEGALVSRDTAGFWIVGLMSGFLLGGMGSLARAQAKATREAAATMSDESLRTVMVKQFGLPYESARQVGDLDANALADRAEEWPIGSVAPQVRFLTAAVDQQANRFEVLVRGWGSHFESWIVDHQVIQAAPATDPEDWDALIEWLLGAAWPLAADPTRGMRLRAIGYDSGGGPGATQQAYDVWLRFRRAKLIAKHGRIDGRDAWNVLPLKGMSGPNAQPLAVVYPGTARKDRRVSSSGEVPRGHFNANLHKDGLAGQLARTESGPWTVHFPAALRSAEPPHSFFEQLVAETRRPDGRWVNAASARNEATDLMVMTHVMARLHVPARFDWERPQAWAASQTTNALVGPCGGRPIFLADRSRQRLRAPLAAAAGAQPAAPAPPMLEIRHGYGRSETVAAKGDAPTLGQRVGSVVRGFGAMLP